MIFGIVRLTETLRVSVAYSRNGLCRRVASCQVLFRLPGVLLQLCTQPSPSSLQGAFLYAGGSFCQRKPQPSSNDNLRLGPAPVGCQCTGGRLFVSPRRPISRRLMQADSEASHRPISSRRFSSPLRTPAPLSLLLLEYLMGRLAS